jgi:hypothetical protein
VVFDGTDDVLSNAVGLFSSVSSYSIFTVFKGNSPSGTAASVITSNLVIPNYMTNGNLMRSYGGSGSNYGESAFTYTDTNPYIFSLQYDGAGSLNADRLKRWKNGSAETLSFTGTIAATTASSTSTVVGAQGTTFNYFKGTIYEIIAYTPVLSESQRQQVQRGLATLWGITLS